nr:hypothetical protein [uncultured Campylobacter sp.]
MRCTARGHRGVAVFRLLAKMSLCSTQGIYIDENGKEHRLVYLHDWEKFCRLFAREQELLKHAPAASKNERSDP